VLATIAAFIATTLILLVFYLYVGVSGLRGGLLLSLLAAVPLTTVVGLVTWGAHRGRIAAVATFTLWGTLLGVWGGTDAPWAPGRLRTEMRTIEVPATYKFEREGVYRMEFFRRWRALGTEAELRAQMLHISWARVSPWQAPPTVRATGTHRGGGCAPASSSPNCGAPATSS
jgi:hypothetical protein